MTDVKVLKAIGQLIVIALTALSLSPLCSARDRQSIERLGTLKLGETVKEFRLQYPEAICGRATSTDIRPQTLVNSGNTNFLHCCLNDLDSLAGFSRLPILNIDDCALHVTFWKGRLHGLNYLLDVRSVQTLLHSFEKLYGQPSDMRKDPEDSTRVTSALWMESGMTLDVHLAVLGREVITRDSTHLAGEPWLQAVSVDLWDLLYG